MNTNCLTVPVCLIFLIALSVLSACSTGQEYPDRDSPASGRQMCTDWATLSLGKLEITNNVWGKRNIQGYTQCIFSSLNPGTGLPDRFGWYWNWPKTVDGVKAYPSVLYGRKPWNDYSTSSKLPQTIDALRRLNVSYSVKSKTSGAVNLLLESWITKSVRSGPGDRVGELAIQLYQKNWPGQAGQYLKPVVINGIPFDFYLDKKISVPGDNLTWAYYGFVHKGDAVLKHEVDIMQFINYLVGQGYISGKYYVASVELGNEIDHGKGQTVIERFSVQVE